MEKPPQKKARPFTRRAFLKGMGGGAAGAALTARFLGERLEASPVQAAAVDAISKKAIAFTVNGRRVSLEVEPRETLLDVLRQRLGLTGAKKGCDRAECGGCTVHLDGRPVYACTYLAIRADGKSVATIEGLADGETLHPVQQAFIEKDGFQCGYCTPGFIMASAALLSRNPAPTPAEIRSGLSGNLCRCGNYVKIYESVDEAARKMRKA
jgi:xanthine dehydrogenase YagT iron-sulfur-binding subunit